MEKISDNYFAVGEKIYGIFPASITIELKGQKKTLRLKQYAVILIDKFRYNSRGHVVEETKDKDIEQFDLALIYKNNHIWKLLETFDKKKDALAYLKTLDDE